MKRKHHPTRESDTVILKRHPLLKAVLDYCLKRLESVIVLAISSAIAVGIGSCNHAKITSTESWVGAHLNEKQAQIDELKETK